MDTTESKLIDTFDILPMTFSEMTSMNLHRSTQLGKSALSGLLLASAVAIGVGLEPTRASAAVPRQYRADYRNGHNTGHTNGFDSGYAVGSERGETEGTTNGHDAGYQEGWDEAYAPAYNTGYVDVYPQGQFDGYVLGMESGLVSGYEWANRLHQAIINSNAPSGSSVSFEALDGSGVTVHWDPWGRDALSGVVRFSSNAGSNPFDWSTYYYDEGYDLGFGKGTARGDRRGYREAYPAAYEAAYGPGLDLGSAEGELHGLSDGGDEGYANGYRLGESAGDSDGFYVGYELYANSLTLDDFDRTPWWLAYVDHLIVPTAPLMIQSVPEPSALALCAAGLLFSFVRRR